MAKRTPAHISPVAHSTFHLESKPETQLIHLVRGSNGNFSDSYDQLLHYLGRVALTNHIKGDVLTNSVNAGGITQVTMNASPKLLESLRSQKFIKSMSVSGLNENADKNDNPAIDAASPFATMPT